MLKSSLFDSITVEGKNNFLNNYILLLNEVASQDFL